MYKVDMFRIMLVTSKKSITRDWLKTEAPKQEVWTEVKHNVYDGNGDLHWQTRVGQMEVFLEKLGGLCLSTETRFGRVIVSGSVKPSV